MSNDYLTIALPKGRLLEQVTAFFAKYDITIKEESRKLDYYDEKNKLRFLFVKNSDVPVYVNYGVAALGISGSDVVYESGFEFLKLGILPFGTTRICLAGFEKDKDLYFKAYSTGSFVKEIKIATKFGKFTTTYFNEKDIPVQIIKLTGSIELAPILGLSDFIVDLVETGTTLKENNLSVIEELGKTQVEIIANPSLYKLDYKKIDNIVTIIENMK
ncbi:MAG: ATP phosphoribosyltransferase [Spirochaetes bacterium GWD1_27_9]|nr:MAG: ATP phosphoribosyltransferase [Spirochaetes bacterium GWB1_27_13]OHD28022.1 MAG: ATP phosphoribosyltransferase [Spirochaetes bacterium GWC1_27_15]OHD34372.1 MAG: ATP phosphoribosyltransferase [Spirochaetes bacterium GWD1_27_9]